MGAACGRISEAETPSGATELREHSDDDSEDNGDLVIARRLAAAPVTPRQVPGVSTLPLSAGSTWSGGASSSGATVSNTGDGTAPRADAANGAAPPLTDGLGRVSSRGGAALGSTTPSHALRWQRGELLGTGAFGRVFLGLNEDTGELLAVKEVLLSGTTMERAAEQLKSLEAEVALMLELSHPNIVRYLGTERTPQALHILLEYVPGGSIASLLSRFGAFAEKLVAVYTRQILEGLHYLHTHHIMHRDIKGANILVDNAGVVKLADFGASRRLADLVTIESGGCKSVKGTPYWMAPEVIKQTGHGRQADIWSVGCTVIEMVTAKPPWSEFTTPVSAMFHIASAKGPPPLPAHISPETKDFLLLCFNRIPKDRPNAGRLLHHPFIAAAWAAGDGAASGTAGTPRGGVYSNSATPGGMKRTFSAIAEQMPSPSVTPSTGPRTDGGASMPPRAVGWAGARTPATGDGALSSYSASSAGPTPPSAGDATLVSPETVSIPSVDEDTTGQALRRKLQLQEAGGVAQTAGTPTPQPGAAAVPKPTESVAFNPMQEPSWSNAGGTLKLPSLVDLPPDSSPPVLTSSPVLPSNAAVAPLTPRGAAPARASENNDAGGVPAEPAAVDAPLSRASSLEPDAVIASRLAVEERERLAAQEQARLDMRRSKQQQWEQELQRELDEQRAQQRRREQEESELYLQQAKSGSQQRPPRTSKS